MDQLDEECARLEAQRDRLRLMVGQSVDPEDHAELAHCVRVLRELASERTKIQEMTDAEVRVRVEGTVYPGATIVICGIIHQVKTPTDRVEFRLDLETNAVIMGPLSKD